MKIKYTIIVLLVFGFSSLSLAQEDFFGIDTKAKRNRMSQSNLGNVFRQAVSNFSFELAAGGNYLNNQMLFNSEQPSFYPIDQVRNISNVSEIASQDTLSFRGAGFGVPINLGVRLNLFDIFTLGGGYGREMGSFSSMSSGDYDFTFDQSAYTFDKLYGTFGLVLYDAKRRVSFLKWRYRKFASQNTYMQSEKNQRMRQNYPWRFILEGEYGQMFNRSSPDANLNFSNEPYYGLALRIEREFSEYARIFVKAGAEFRSLVYAPQNLEEFQNIQQSVYGAQIGLSISLPGTKRCKVQGCGVVMKHLHEGVEYRGSSIWNFQNRKVGQWY